MDLRPYVENIHRQLAVAAEASGDDARELVGRLVAPLDAVIHLTLQDVLSAAAEEITCQLAPGSIELRLRGREPEFVVTAPPVDMPVDDASEVDSDRAADGRPAAGANNSAETEGEARAGPGADTGAGTQAGADEGAAMSRINLRMPDQLKARIEQAAGREGLSVNSWLVRAAAAALERTDPGRRRQRPAPQGAQRYTGWAR
jgi:predicted HicB family RNase H-like nuclease